MEESVAKRVWGQDKQQEGLRAGRKEKDGFMDPITSEQMTKLAEFFAWVIGPDYEIVISNYENGKLVPLAIFNDFNGVPICKASTAFAETMVAQGRHMQTNYVIHHYGFTDDGRILRCSVFFLKNAQGALRGAISVNFIQDRYQKIINQIYQLCHPNYFIDRANNQLNNPFAFPEISFYGNEVEDVPPPVDNIAAMIPALLHGKDISALTKNERQKLVQALASRDVFKMRGSVKHVSKLLGCSPATIYRYLSSNDE